MPQELLPIFPEGDGAINGLVSFEKRDGQVYYFHGGLPVFSHAEKDTKSFRLFVSQLVVNGSCRQVDIVRAFGISPIGMKRYVKKYREGGAGAFFKEPKRRGNRVLTTKVVACAQGMLNEGRGWREVADELGIKRNTFSKALRSGRLVEGGKKTK
jgi:predicted transcriptional regulator